jgi:RimJ/RimL family protein N-acetyltransferase
VDQDDPSRRAAGDDVAGTVTLWTHGAGDQRISEIGWMVLPEFQGRGLGKRAVRMVLDAARADGRWGTVHAFPAVTNGPSNGMRRSLGFTYAGEQDTEFAGRRLRTCLRTIETTHRS